MSTTTTKTNAQKYGFEPTQREFDLYNKQKEDMYKGTFYVCLAYGLAALALLLLGAFTEWGREYIYGKMLPATATFVIGAFIIIIYLSATIYSLKPKQLTTKQDSDGKIICPDYWRLQKIDSAEREALAAKYNLGTNRPDRMESTDSRIQYKCVMDNNSTISLNNVPTNNELYKKSDKYKPGFKGNVPEVARIENNPNYIYVEKDVPNSINTDATLHDYAEVSGIYNHTSPTAYTIVPKAAVNSDFFDKKPLKCNEVIPGLLEDYDIKAKEANKYRCLYAKTCDVPWTDMNCKYEMNEV